MKSTVMAVLVAGALALSVGGSTLAAGKLGGASGMDNLAVSLSGDDQDGAGNETGDRPTTQGGKVGGSMDRPARLGGKLGVGTGDD
jgi:hypothetical protein